MSGISGFLEETKKFRVGDKVEFVRYCERNSVPRGTIGQVCSVFHNIKAYRVMLANGAIVPTTQEFLKLYDGEESGVYIN